MIRKGFLLFALLGAALAVSGCPGDSGGSAPGGPRSGRGSSAPRPRDGTPTSNRTRGESGPALFSLPMVDGQTAAVRTPAALFFFTTWCGYCKQVMPDLKRQAERARARGWHVYGINVNEGPQQVAAFIQQYQPNFPILLDQQGVVARQYGLRGYPTFVVIDQNANIIYNGHELPQRF